MKVGFTGTRHGMLNYQKRAFTAWILAHPEITEFRYGDCVGADADAAAIVDAIRIKSSPILIVCHPPLDSKHRAWSDSYDEICSPKTHFARNRDIVNESDLLVVCPADMCWQPCGGTWYTHDFCRNKDKPVVIIWPHGVVQEHAEEKQV